MGRVWIGWVGAAVVAVGACAASGDDSDGTGGTSQGGSTSSSGTGASSTGTGGEGGLILAGGHGGNVEVDPCKVVEGEGDAPPPCDDIAPSDSFSPEVQWTWTAPGAMGSLATTLAANFDDDNLDGATDLCDVPDVVVTAYDSIDTGTLYLLSGDTGELKLTFAAPVDPNITPALGDIDNDGLVEVVAASPSGHLIAFENTGELKWTGALGGWEATISSYCTAISLYDLDANGSVEIIAAFEVFDSTGNRLFGIPGNGTEFVTEDYWCPTSAAADLNGDGTLEVIFGHQAYHADGTHYWTVPGARPGHPHVANFDSDDDPEIYLATADGMWVLEHDGTVKFGPVRPTDPQMSARCWGKPGAVHDFNGDGAANVATGTCTDYSVYTISTTAAPNWSAQVADQSGLATGTAFDFLGDGVADAIYADETQIYVYEGLTGALELSSPRNSGTLIEYPIVVDVDNDRSAEIIYVSNYLMGGGGATVTVLRDAQDRWIPARRIWNQHSYHVTNVREDGTIPPVPKKSWLGLNTFRTNSQVGAEGDCIPEPPR